MNFGMSLVNLSESIDSYFNDETQKILGAPQPANLYHYTKFDGALGIVRSSILRATCLADQSDPMELKHGIDLVNEAIKTLKEKLSAFSLLVINRAVEIMFERIKWYFITCFCGHECSVFHWNEFGPYRLNVPQSRIASLRCSDWQATRLLLPVVYDQELQRESVIGAVRTITREIDKHLFGTPSGPIVQWHVSDCAGIVSTIFLQLLLSFKREKHKHEEEWRLVFCPHFNPLSAVPAIADESFTSAIRKDQVTERRYIDLRIQKKNCYLIPPFVSIQQIPQYENLEELRQLKTTLAERGNKAECF